MRVVYPPYIPLLNVPGYVVELLLWETVRVHCLCNGAWGLVFYDANNCGPDHQEDDKGFGTSEAC